MRLRFAVNTVLAAVVVGSAVYSCATKEKDPLDDIKSLIPKIEKGLNRRDLAGLKGMGTVQFESNSFVIDVFGEHVRDSVTLSLSRIQQDGAEATLILNMTSRQRAGEKRELHVRLKGGEKWKIDSYEILEPGAHDSDTSRPGEPQ
jgi:hypothetical protein